MIPHSFSMIILKLWCLREVSHSKNKEKLLYFKQSIDSFFLLDDHLPNCNRVRDVMMTHFLKAKIILFLLIFLIEALENRICFFVSCHLQDFTKFNYRFL